MGVDLVILADSAILPDHDVRADDSTGPDVDVIFDYGKRADRD
jgi:hypothetical protein